MNEEPFPLWKRTSTNLRRPRMATEDYFGPDILGDVIQLYFNDIGLNALLLRRSQTRAAGHKTQVAFDHRVRAAKSPSLNSWI